MLLIDSVITPYIIPRYNAIQKKLDWKLIVWFQSFTDINRKRKTFPKTEFEYEFLKDKPFRLVWKDIFTFHINYDFPKKLKKLDPDHIIIIWRDSFASLYAVLRAKRHKKRITLRAWSTKYEKSRRRMITSHYVRWFVKYCDDYISYGTRATEYLVSLWAKKDKIQPFYNTVDIEYFKKESDKYKINKEKIKKQLWIHTKYVLMFNGQLIERKWIWEMIDGFYLFQKEHKDISLLIIGSGQEEQKIKDYIQEKNIKNVFFTGYVQIDELPKYYAISDIFTLPSREEVWWLVINEAMACGLPVITTYEVWASVDLLKEWKNGYIMKENSAGEFKKWLKYIFDKDLINSNTSLDIISKFTLENILKHIKL